MAEKSAAREDTTTQPHSGKSSYLPENIKKECLSVEENAKDENPAVKQPIRPTLKRLPPFPHPSIQKDPVEKGKGKEISIITTTTATQTETMPSPTKIPLDEDFLPDKIALHQARSKNEQLVQMLARQVTVNQDMLSDQAIIQHSLEGRIKEEAEANEELQLSLTVLRADKHKTKEENARLKEENKEITKGMKDLCELASNLCAGPAKQKGPWEEPMEQMREALVSAVWSSYDYVQRLEERERRLLEKVEGLKRKVRRRDDGLKARRWREGLEVKVNASEGESEKR